MREASLLALLAVFVPFSLVSIGGGPSVFAGVQYQVVEARHWLSPDEFVAAFAISRSAPGPGTMLSTLIGWKMAGWSGAAVATLGMFVPSSLVCYAVARDSSANKDKKWHRALRMGLSPIAVGLLLAGILAIYRMSGAGFLFTFTALTSSTIMIRWPNVNPIFVLVGAGVLFAAAEFGGLL